AELVAPALHGFRARADEMQPATLDDLSELGVLREETVTRVDGVRRRDLGGADQSRHVKVALRGRSRTDAHRLVRETHVERAGVGLGVNGHGADAELTTRADHA